MKPEASSFELAVARVLDSEGGYVDHPDDPGGETKYGISKRSYPDLDIRRLSRQQAIDIYRADFWEKCRGDELPGPLGFVVFDGAVNHGVSRSIKCLQHAVGGTADGVIGPMTMAATTGADTGNLITEVLARRAVFYTDLVAKRPQSRVFLNGWMRRLFTVQQHAID